MGWPSDKTWWPWPVLLLCKLAFIASLTGCSSWHGKSSRLEEVAPRSQKTKSNSQLGQSDRVTLETALVRFDEQSLPALDLIWESADESILDFSQRRLLDANGIRVGLLRGELPTGLVKQIESNRMRQQLDVAEQIGLSSDANSRAITLVCRAGRRSEWLIRRELPAPLTVLSSNGESTSGITLSNASTLFGLTVFPQLDSRTIVEMVPEVQFGEQRTTYVSSEFGLRQEVKRDSKIWKQLKIRAAMATGDTLMLSSTKPSKALGHAFFTSETSQQSEDRVVALVRLASQQRDNLFDDDRASQSGTTAEH